MKKITFALLLVAALPVFADSFVTTGKLTLNTKLKWTIPVVFKNPESVAYCAGKLYVSSIDGEPTKKDGNGYLSEVSLEGKVLKQKWATKLNAPKGIRCSKDTLWVSDIDTLHSFDLVTGKRKSSLKFPEAKFLNDVAIRGNEVFVSDTMLSAIFSVVGGKINLVAKGPELHHPNGLLVVGNDLLVASWGTEMAPDFATKAPGEVYTLALPSKETGIATTVRGNFDGLEHSEKFGYFVSDWMAGKVFNNEKEIISGLKGAADIAWVEEKNLLMVPEMNESKLHAYEIDPDRSVTH